jgi:hypothetical protein
VTTNDPQTSAKVVLGAQSALAPQPYAHDQHFALLSKLFLLAFRLTSCHAIDALMSGSIKLNWVIDIGAEVAVQVAATQQAWILRERP